MVDRVQMGGLTSGGDRTLRPTVIGVKNKIRNDLTK